MATSSATAFFCFFLLFLTITTASSIPLNNTSTDFIKSHCNTTLYPSLCYTSLVRYSAAIQTNPVALAQVAAMVTFSRLKSTSSHVASLLPASTGAEAAALRDCIDQLGNAADLTKRSKSEIAKLKTAVGIEVAWMVSNAQTWMSASLTNEETCTDGFQAVGAGQVKNDVCGRVGRVKEYTSNVLALVNSLVNGK